MSATQVVPGLHRIPLGQVNAYLLDSPDGCALIDAGFPGSADAVLAAVAAAGRRPADVRHLILTHAHPDHIGSAAALRRATGAAVYVHTLDADIVRAGTGFRPLTPAPNPFAQLLVRLVIRPKLKHLQQLDPTPVDHELGDGDVLHIAGGLRVIHTPGHCAGHVALLWPRHGGVLIAGDAAGHVLGLNVSVANEDLPEAKRSLRKLGRWTFTTACFGHGRPIQTAAAARLRRRWPAPVTPATPPPPPPRTVAEAVDRLASTLQPDMLDLIRGAAKADVAPMHHFGLGLWVRNNFGLWVSGSELLESCGTTQADAGSSIILQALWDHLVLVATPDELARSREHYAAFVADRERERQERQRSTPPGTGQP